MITSLFWTTYLNDWTNHGFKLLFLVMMLMAYSLWYIIRNRRISDLGLRCTWRFILGYIIADPFAYYVVNYLNK